MNAGTLANIVLSPLLPWPLIAVAFGLAVLALLPALARQARGALWRLAAVAALAVALLDPRWVMEERRPLSDVAVVMVDRSASQSLGRRADRTEEALHDLTRALAREKDLEVRVVPFGEPRDGAQDQGTRMFEALAQAIADIPRQRIAGVVALTDGQIHDVPPEATRATLPGPIHVLLTGEHKEADRRLVVEQSPRYGIVGRPFRITARLEDSDLRAGAEVPVVLRRDGIAQPGLSLPAGRSTEIELAVDHAGPTIFELEAAEGARELTLENNRAVVVVNGVRDRLRVLLVSGEPHAGARAWRDLMRSDPAVDLVHFTILRPPEKQDDTPLEDLSLITFPVHELFQEKLADFDLVVFDRYRRRGVLPNAYLANVAEYVRHGGAILVAAGPDFATPLSLFHSPLGEILPVQPTGDTVERGFRPALSQTGKRHPVTAGLAGEDAQWGRWFRQIGGLKRAGIVLMEGPGAQPLLTLDRVGDGRVAQLQSDQIWLWERGFEGGGPQAELLRRLAHWLMKEPELEEEALTARIHAGRLDIARRSLEDSPTPVAITITAPDGTTRQTALTEQPSPGLTTASLPATQPGLWRVSDGKHIALAASGSLDTVEMGEVRTSEAPLAPVVAATNGSTRWLVDGQPSVRRVRPGAATNGASWIGLRANGDYSVEGLRETALPPWSLLLAALCCLAMAWGREGG